MSEFKKIMGVISGSSAPRPVMTLLETGVGARTSTHYEKYAPKSRIIISVENLETTVLVPEIKAPEPASDSKASPKDNVRSIFKDQFAILIETLLPDGAYHLIAEFQHEGDGTGELIIDDLPSNWRLSVMTKSKHSYSVFGY